MSLSTGVSRSRDSLRISLSSICSEDAPHCKGQDREGEPSPRGAVGWHNAAAARPDEGKQFNGETEICGCVKNVMVLCPLLR